MARELRPGVPCVEERPCRVRPELSMACPSQRASRLLRLPGWSLLPCRGVADSGAQWFGTGTRPREIQFGIEKADVEGSVVDHQFGTADELEKFVRDVGEARLVGEKKSRVMPWFAAAPSSISRSGLRVLMEMAAGEAGD